MNMFSYLGVGLLDLLIVCFLTIEFWEFCVYSRFKSFIKHVIFSPSLFVLFKVSFAGNIFLFWWNPIIIFLFYGSYFLISCQTTLTYCQVTKIISCFLLRLLQFYVLYFRSKITFELIFTRGLLRTKIFLPMNVICPNIICWKHLYSFFI